MLTSKVAIVQGPPGTGKSFVGEKFLQILFENRNRLPQLRPILLLSETNHALDAVLLGLQRYMGKDVFNRSVARFGTRATDPSLEEVFVNRIAKGHERAYVTGTECTSEAIIAIYSLMMNLSDFTWKRNSCSCTDALRWMESIASALPRTTVSESIVHLCRKLVAAEKNLELFVKQQIQRAQDILCALSSTPTQVADVRKQHLEIAAETDSGASGVMVDLGIRRKSKAERTTSANHFEAKSDVARLKHLMAKPELDLALHLDDELAKLNFSGAAIKIPISQDVIQEDFGMARVGSDVGAQVVSGTDSNDDYTETTPYSALRDVATQCLHTVTQTYLSQVSNVKTQNTLGLCELLRGRFLIAGTTTTATRDLEVLRYLQTNVVMVEEAAEVREEGVWACLTEHTEQLILIGDHMQLRPKIATSFLRTAERHGTAASMMERLVATLKAPHKTITTQTSYDPDVANLAVSPYYKMKIGLDIVSHPSTVQRPNMSLLPSRTDSPRIVWMSFDSFEKKTSSGSWMNATEANIAIRLAMLLRCVHERSGVKSQHGNSITILTFYRDQVHELESAAKRNNVLFGAKEIDLRIKTVDEFQGEESDVVILSTVRTTDKRHMLKFVEAENRWCVALSRACSQLYIICSRKLFCAPLQPGRNTLQSRAAGVHIAANLYANLIASRPHPDCETINADALVAQVCSDSSHETKLLHWLEGSTTPLLVRCGETCGKPLLCGHPCSMKCHDGNSCDPKRCMVSKIVRLECGHDQPTHCGSV
ncbi:Hypothetical protein, putative, partial [Bodo saltans]